MVYLIPNSFSYYSMTDEETLQGSILSIPQKQVIQNHLAKCAEEKLLLEYDPSNPSVFLQQEAYKRGQIDILTYLLDESSIAEDTAPDHADKVQL